jgi:hypothetical protein
MFALLVEKCSCGVSRVTARAALVSGAFCRRPAFAVEGVSVGVFLCDQRGLRLDAPLGGRVLRSVALVVWFGLCWRRCPVLASGIGMDLLNRGIGQ